MCPGFLLTLKLYGIFVLSMRMPAAYSPIRGQTSLEYLLLLAVVAVAVIASFSSNPNSLVSQIHDTAQGYYNTVTRVIMGNGNETIDGKQITPINGGWCSVTCPASGSFGPTVMYRSCECPAPAFGGAYCSGSGQVACNGVNACFCPITGQVCGAVPVAQRATDNPSGCGCSNGLDCSSVPGSLTDPTCTQCICPTGWYFDQSANPPACVNYCPDPCTTFDGTKCVPTVCTNGFCDSTQTDTKKECACFKYSYWDSSTSSCAYCQVDGNKCTDVNSAGTGCQDINSCPANQFCDTTLGDPGYDSCRCNCNDSTDPNNCTYWKGNTCVPGNCKASPACPIASNGSPSPNGCGQDSCGGFCGANNGNCPTGEKCNNTTGDVNGPPGTCVTSCPDTEIWNGILSRCVPLTPCGSNDCGYDSDGTPCGSNSGGCSGGEPCSSGSNSGTTITAATLPGLCCLPCQHWEAGACKANTACGTNWSADCGKDSCGNACGSNGGNCPPAGQPTWTKCSASGQCVPN